MTDCRTRFSLRGWRKYDILFYFTIFLLSPFQLWRPVQTALDGNRSRGSAVQPAIGLHVQLGPGRWHSRTHHWLAHRGSAQAKGQSTHYRRGLTWTFRAQSNFLKTYVSLHFCKNSTSGETEHQQKGAYPGNSGSQTRPGSGLPGVPVQSHINAGENPGPRWKAAEASSHSSGRLESMLDVLYYIIRITCAIEA